ncbi:SDR family NAD(P)-dependent oxidoreductase [Streptomyces sp. NPDC004232]|uniref:SDR family NAD(P)-dependent oxidoreductase n=1 Tax=unclassified Streptomyces TaxID=2593676 RepID=UPI0033A46737
MTGAISGIGTAVAETLGEYGTHVLVASRDRRRGEAIRQRGGMADSVVADLLDADSVRQLAGHAVELGGGRVDTLYALDANAPLSISRAGSGSTPCSPVRRRTKARQA